MSYAIVETCLYVEDLERSIQFYLQLLGCEVVARDSRFCAFDLAPGQLLLLFDRRSTDDITLPNGDRIPAHHGAGRLHVGFGVEEEQLAQLTSRMAQLGIAIESHVSWPRGGKSVYLRDPDGHLVEFLTRGVWPSY